MSTLQDISDKLQISIATVSNALNGKGRMRRELRQKIIDTAAEMGYSFTEEKSAVDKNIIIIAEDITVSFCADIAGGAIEYGKENSISCPLYSLGLCKKYGPRTPEDILAGEIRSLLENIDMSEVAGIIFIADTPRKFGSLFKGVSCEVVYVYCQTSEPIFCVNYNDRQGARLASSVLISHGAKKIAMFSGLLDSIPMSNRMFGYQLALNDAGIPFDPTILYIGDWTLESGYRLAIQMIEKGEAFLPDAIFSQNDEMAAGICQAFAEKGIKVPEQVEIIGFDDKEPAEYTFPPLSTIRPPLAGLGREAMKHLLSSDTEENEKNIFLPCELIERGTTKSENQQRI